MLGYLGPEGTFTQIACKAYLGDCLDEVELRAYSSIPLLFRALESEDVSSVFIPVENSFGGDVFDAFEGLVPLADSWKISAEFFFKIEQSFIGKPGATFTDISTIFSHEQSARQCSVFLEKELGGAEVVYVSSNAVAAERVSESEWNHVACLGHKSLADRYGLTVLRENVHGALNLRQNVTRFIEVSRRDNAITGADKTSFVCSTVKDKPGSLCDILTSLSKENLNMTRISSQPSKTGLGEYVFLIDFEGHYSESHVKKCLADIEANSSFYTFLGSYPKGSVYD